MDFFFSAGRKVAYSELAMLSEIPRRIATQRTRMNHRMIILTYIDSTDQDACQKSRLWNICRLWMAGKHLSIRLGIRRGPLTLQPAASGATEGIATIARHSRHGELDPFIIHQ